MNSPWPLLITLTYVVIAMVIGLRAKAGRSMNSLEEWGVAGRSMGPVTLYLLIAAGSVSAYTFMGAPGWAYSKGVAVFYVAIYLAYLALVAWYFGPKVWQFGEQFGHVTQASAISDRYQSPALGALAALVMAIGSVAYAVLQTIGSAYILFVMSGGLIPIWLGVVLVLACIAVYLYVSGQRAIGRTNAFQGVLMLIVAWAVGLWAVHSATGGLSFAGVFERIQTEHSEFLTLPGAGGDMSFSFWTTSIIVSMFSFMPPVWTQWMSASSARTIRRSATWLPTYYVVILPMVVVGFIGIFSLPELARADTVVLEYAMQHLPVVLVGLLGAGTLAASMSSSEPFIHSVSLSLSKDVIQPVLKLSDAVTGKLARLLILPIMFLVIAPLAIAEPGSLVMILLVGLGFASQVMPAFIGMFFWPRASRLGVMAGIVVGFLITTAFTILWPHPMGIHAGFWGLMLNLPVFIVISLMTPSTNAEVVERFFRIAAPRGLTRLGRKGG
ncbi:MULTISPECIES: sodium:solute symporter family protein [Halomonadaceae]|uniref:Sodium:solute symporter family protein n=2 Tax=Vreelandella TaxID=3137766 RepID=A0A7Z0LUJ3_9GAMM|nr:MULTISPECIES: sodium:solute symporter family protein [Halomonas]NYS78864.1 sodium:solute symporter family protein [Halomonas glaciei]|tara:strand:- start:1179 stop:2669 length:1491 start_codon:yes stop_codon:yes gene_type:complete